MNFDYLPGHRGNSSLKRAGAKIAWTPDMIAEYVKCRDDPIYFAKNYVKIITGKGLVHFDLRDYQEEMIQGMHENRNSAFCFARQSGKSVTVCAYLLWFALFNDQKTIGILANKAETAREILGHVRRAFVNLPKWMTHGIADGGWNKGSIALENGSRIIAAASSSDSVRGYTLDILYLDECAFIEHFDEFFKGVYATISSRENSKVIMTSTPNGLNHFYQTIELGKRGENGYFVLEVPWHRVPGRDEKWKEETLKSVNYDQALFDQEYNIQFLGSSGTLIAGWKLRELTHQIPILEKDNLKQYIQPQKDHIYAIVCDVSRGKGLDHSAFSVIDITQMPYQQVAVYRSNMILPTDYADIIHHVAKQYNEANILVETNDIGEAITNILYFDYEYINILYTENNGNQGKRISQGFSGKKTERGVRTTKRVKLIGCSVLKMLIEQNQLIINDMETISELSTFSKKNDSYEAEEGHHDDIVMGLVLFAWMTDQDFFKGLTDINTIFRLRDKTEEEIFETVSPFGYRDRGDEGLIDFEGELVEAEDVLMKYYIQ